MSQGIHTTPRRLLGLATALLIALGSLVLTASPAAAHDQLLESTPAADATVEGLPAELVLTFSASITPDAGASEVQVTDAAGTPLAGEPLADGTTLTVPLAGDASGVVSVVWKVVSSDGHPISGEFAFTVTPVATPTQTPSATPTPTESTAPVETAEPAPTSSAPATPEDEDSTFAGVWPWVVGGLVIAGIGGAVLYLLVSRARRQKALGEHRENAVRTAPATPSDPGSDTPSEH